jgi:hypothetical protein
MKRLSPALLLLFFPLLACGSEGGGSHPAPKPDSSQANEATDADLAVDAVDAASAPLAAPCVSCPDR